jgi:hypothetical protein
MMDHVGGMGWMMAGMGLFWLLVLVLLVLGIAALVKYLSPWRVSRTARTWCWR